jgi:hypothetical protein
MSTTTSSGNATDKVKYDYIYDYTVPTVTEAAAFCNAFTVTGANPYNAGANALQTAVFADSTGAVKTLLVNALGAAAAWWGASMGGRHRDENTDLSTYMRW